MQINIGSDHDLTFSGVKRARTGTYLNSATCTWQLLTSAGATIPGASGTLTYVTGSNGDYTGIVDASVTGTLASGTAYLIDVVFSDTDGDDDHRRLSVTAGYRSEN